MIEHRPSRTRCYCGSVESLEFCATCRGWLVEHSCRIAIFWAWCLVDMETGREPAFQGDADTAEGFYDHLYESMR